MNAPPVHTTHSDSLVAVRNAMKLGMSLLGTWAVALGIKLVLPRYLGPTDFGVVNFAENFAAAWFVLTGFGIDTYVRKEIPVRLEHANEFFGSVYLLRLVASAALLAVIAGVLIATGRDGVVLRTVLCFALGQVFFTSNNTYAAILHASGHVNGVAILNVVAKLVWGAGIVLGFLFGRHLEVVGIAFAAAEGVKAGALAYLTRRHVALPLVWNPLALKTVMKASLPFFLVALSGTLSNRIDVTIIEFLANKTEVGWYGAATNVAGLALLLTPLIGWVLLPLSSRAASRGEEELLIVTRRSIELILSIAFPVSLMLMLGADVVVALLFGDAYLPAIPALRTLSGMFVLTYLAMVATTTLVRLERSWYVTVVTLGGVVLQIALNIVLIPIVGPKIGDGGAGLASALSVITSEVVITVALLAALGNKAFDKRSISRLARTALVVGAVIAIDRALVPEVLALGWDVRLAGALRVAIDAMSYAVLVVLTGALDLGELIGFIRQAIAQKRGT
ncbi:MAG: flippase [Deltaproteobacteria bacterium]|nr:flippase [Deltaproteobacteria bacterium]